MTVLTVKVEDEINQWLDLMAQKNKKSKSSYIKEILRMYKEDAEDAGIVLERLNQKNARYLSTEDVEAELGFSPNFPSS